MTVMMWTRLVSFVPPTLFAATGPVGGGGGGGGRRRPVDGWRRGGRCGWRRRSRSRCGAGTAAELRSVLGLERSLHGGQTPSTRSARSARFAGAAAETQPGAAVAVAAGRRRRPRRRRRGRRRLEAQPAAADVRLAT